MDFKQKRFLVVALFLCGSFFAGNAAHADIDNKAATVPWGYTGNISPDKWSSLDADFKTCATGKYQMPIDITHVVVTRKNNLHIAYHVAPLDIIYEGMKNLTIGKHKIKIKDSHTIQVAFPPSTKERVAIAGNHYRLMQFHFHTPSENHLQGRAFPLEIHFVNQAPNGKVAVIAVFVKAGKENPALNPILTHLPKLKGKAYEYKHVTINPAALLPKNQSYYAFMGSLTTPPCTEGLQWLVMQHPIQASAEQIAQIERAQHGNNARPLQAANNREIVYVPQQ